MALALLLALQDVDELIRRLGHDSIEERDKAQAALLELGEKAEEKLRVYAGGDDPEVKGRASYLLNAIEVRRSGIPDAWLKANGGLFHMLALGGPEELESVLLDVRGVGRMPEDRRRVVAARAPLRGRDAGAMLNYMLKRIASSPDRYAAVLEVMFDCSTQYGAETGFLQEDVAEGFDVVFALTILPRREDVEFVSVLQGCLSPFWTPGMSERLLRSKLPWDRIPAHSIESLLRRERRPDLLPELIDLTAHSNPEARRLGAKMMGVWRTDPERSVPTLRKLLDDEPPGARAESLGSLLTLGDGKTRGLVSGLCKDRHSEVRRIAFSWIGRLRLEGAEAVVLPSLENEEWVDRYHACASAGELALASATPLLKEIVLNRHQAEGAAAVRALPFTDDALKSDDLLEMYTSKQRGNVGADGTGWAMIMTGKTPRPGSFEEIVRELMTQTDQPSLLGWLYFESGEDGRKALEEVMTRPLPLFTSRAFGLLKRVDPAKLGSIAAEMLQGKEGKELAHVFRLTSFGGIPVPRSALEKAMDLGEPWAISNAAYLMAEQGLSDVAPRLLGAVKAMDPATEVTRSALSSCLFCLARLRYAEALPLIVSLTEQNVIGEQTAGNALAQFGADAIREKLGPWIQSGDVNRLSLALRILQSSTDAGDIATLETFMEDPREKIRTIAVESWGSACAAASPERLRVLAADPSACVRSAVLKILERTPDVEAALKLAETRGSAGLIRRLYKTGRISRERIEPFLRRGMELDLPLNELAVEVFMEDGWPADMLRGVFYGKDPRPYYARRIAAHLDQGEADMLYPALTVLPHLYGKSEYSNVEGLVEPVAVALNALTEKAAYGRLKGVRVKRGEGPAEIAKAAGLKYADARDFRIEWPADRPEMSAMEYLITMTGDLRMRVAPVMTEGELKLLGWNDAIQFWRAEHIRRAREK